MHSIDADVTELRARWRLSTDTDIVELIHAEQERIFFEESGLDRVRPGLAVRLSRPVGYIELLETIQLHGYHAMFAAGQALDRTEIVAAWLEQVYEPAVDAFAARSSLVRFPARPRRISSSMSGRTAGSSSPTVAAGPSSTPPERWRGIGGAAAGSPSPQR